MYNITIQMTGLSGFAVSLFSCCPFIWLHVLLKVLNMSPNLGFYLKEFTIKQQLLCCYALNKTDWAFWSHAVTPAPESGKKTLKHADRTCFIWSQSNVHILVCGQTPQNQVNFQTLAWILQWTPLTSSTWYLW